jgi:hypothetical protein
MASVSALSSTPEPLREMRITVSEPVDVGVGAGAGAGPGWTEATTVTTAGDEVTVSTVARTSHVAEVAGAVYRPRVSIVPHVARQRGDLVDPVI